VGYRRAVGLRRGAPIRPIRPSSSQRQQGGPEKSKPAGFVADGQFQPKCLGSELSRQIAVDLESDADLDEGRGCPGHWPFPSVFMNTARYIGSRSESNLRGAPTRTTAPGPRSGAATAPGLLQGKRDRTHRWRTRGCTAARRWHSRASSAPRAFRDRPHCYRSRGRARSRQRTPSPADVYFGRDQRILKIKRKTIAERRRLHFAKAA
jgi:hypothetical protein